MEEQGLGAGLGAGLGGVGGALLLPENTTARHRPPLPWLPASGPTLTAAFLVRAVQTVPLAVTDQFGVHAAERPAGKLAVHTEHAWTPVLGGRRH